MPPTGDDIGVRILGEVQALRGELGRLRDRAHARAIKRRLLDLYARAERYTGPVTQIEPEAKPPERLPLEASAAGVRFIVAEFTREAEHEIVRMLGTSAWDEPGPAPELPPLPESPFNEPHGGTFRDLTPADVERLPTTPVTMEISGRFESAEPPLTDEELDETEHVVAEWVRLLARHPAVAEEVRGSRLYGVRLVEPEIVRRLVAEVRRLRSDEWLEAAAAEIAALPTEADPSAPVFTWEQRTASNADTVEAILREHRDGKA